MLMDENKPDEAAKEFQGSSGSSRTLRFHTATSERPGAMQRRLDKRARHVRQVAHADPDLQEAHFNLGNVYLTKENLAQAVVELNTAVRRDPGDLEAQKRLGEGVKSRAKLRKRFPTAGWSRQPGPTMRRLILRWGRRALGPVSPKARPAGESVRLAPNTPQCLNALAWVYATSPKTEIRNGTEAVRLATLACQITKEKNPEMLDTRTACAEAGRFDEAIKATGKILALAQATHDTRSGHGPAAVGVMQARKPYEMNSAMEFPPSGWRRAWPFGLDSRGSRFYCLSTGVARWIHLGR